MENPLEAVRFWRKLPPDLVKLVSVVLLVSMALLQEYFWQRQ